MRVRTRDSRTARNKFQITHDTTCTSGTVQESSAAAALVGDFRQTSDFVTPGYREKIAKGEIINNPFTTYAESHESSGDFGTTKSVATTCSSPVKNAVWEYKGPWDLYAMNGNTPGSYLYDRQILSASDVRSALQVAANNCWSSVRQNSADLPQDLAEIVQTIKLLRNPLQLCHATVDEFSRHKLRYKAGHGKQFYRSQYTRGRLVDVSATLESNWLAFRFGFRPLWGSLVGIVDSLSQPSDGTLLRYTGRGHYSLSKTDTTTSVVVGTQTTRTRTLNVEENYTLRCGVLYDKSFTEAQLLGFDKSAFFTTPYNLIPYSFVLDSFVTTGSLLAGFVPYLSTETLAAWTVIKRECIITHQVTSMSANSGYTLLVGPTEFNRSTYSKTNRSIGVDSPGIVFKPQSLKRVLGDLRVVDYLLLLTQKMRHL